MALTTMQLYSLAAVLAIILGVLLYNNAMAKRATQAKAGTEEEESVSPLLSRFAHHEGSVVGETVAVEGGQLILKQEGVFKAVPRAMATLEGDEVVLQGYIDWDAARAEGAAWLEAHRKGVDDAVTSQLTRSEDVRAPALAAWKERRGDEMDDGEEADVDEEDDEVAPSTVAGGTGSGTAIDDSEE